MARPQRSLDTTRPLHAFAAELRKLRVTAGEPKYLAMSRKVGDVSRTALAEAAGGDHLPSWHTVEKFVIACGGDPNDWRQHWEELRDAAANRPQLPEGMGPQADPALALPRIDQDEPRRPRRIALLVVLAATFMILASLGIVLMARHGLLEAAAKSGNQVPAPVPSGPVIIVQNMIAIGGDSLIEDSTPAYLSTRTVPRCRLNGCMIHDSILATGTTVVATCKVQSTRMTNYNMDSTEVQRNPNRADSTLWYRLILPDGTAGFLAEVYMTPASRGGLGLPTCALDVPVSAP